MLPIKKIISGGQTGVDRAALDVALALNIPCGGWCPQGRKAEDGPLAARYPLRETSSTSYALRTRWNVRDSDGTLILTIGPLTGGTALTRSFALKHHKPVRIVKLDKLANDQLAATRHWLAEHHIKVLNVAGPRASSSPGIDQLTEKFLKQLLTGPVRKSPTTSAAPGPAAQ